MTWQRYAIYHVPDGAFGDAGADWLGWDIRTGRFRTQPAVAGIDLAAVTAEARRYGFHATIKPPFRLAARQGEGALRDAVASLAARLAPAGCAGLRLGRIGAFLALVPEGDAAAIGRLAVECVRALDPFRAPTPPEEVARRRSTGLTPAQEGNLDQWGYPYVMEEFRFHMTLTGSLATALAEQVQSALAPRFEAVLPRPFRLDTLCLAGEAGDGFFRVIARYALSG